MVEVLKQGIPYKDRYFDVGCPRCLSLLKFKGDEVIEATDFNYIYCPVCPQEAPMPWVNVAKATPR
jgi:hypothetical protein